MSIRKAVSLIFKYRNKVFVIKRQNYLRYFPGYTAFPGGKVERDEDDLIQTVLREAKEELGLDLAAMNDKEVKSIKAVARATTPDFNPYRFETYFYLIECKVKPDFELDKNEMTDARWCDPYDVIRDYNSGKILIVPPVKDILEKLSDKKLEKEYLDFDLRERKSIPVIEPIKDIIQLLPYSNTLPPAERTNCFVIGDNKKVLVDPSPRDMDEYRKLISLLEAYPLDKVFITHHHKDHHEYATQIAKHFNLPIYISEDSFERIKKFQDQNYFDGCETVFVQEGDVLARWIGQEVKAYAIPGHDQGHFGLAPERMNWFLVGDLFQGIGTVVVGGEEGSMQDYFASLKKVIELAPQCVIPSHGIALGGVHMIEKTLEHRRLRESQIIDLLKQDKDIDDIVKTIYFDIPRTLHPYAKANVVSHIEKIKLENLIK